MGFSVDVEDGWVKFKCDYAGPRNPTDVHIFVGSRSGAGLIGYPTIPQEINPRRGFEMKVAEGNPNLPHDDQGHLKWGTTFTLVWSFATEPKEEEDPDHPEYPSMAEKLANLLKGLANAKCFIATAAFGSPAESEVLRLQLWRERVLRPSRAGRAVIAVYERVSPPIARVIARRRNGALGKAVRSGLHAFLRWADRDGR